MLRAEYGEYTVSEAGRGDGPQGDSPQGDSAQHNNPQVVDAVERQPGSTAPHTPATVTKMRHSVVTSIFQNYHRILMKYLRERLPNQHEAEDVAQEVYYRIARKPDLKELDFPKAFLMRVAKNLLIDMARMRKHHFTEVPIESDFLEPEDGDPDSTPEGQLQGEELLKAIEAALAELSPKCQAVFIMNRIDGITFRQIAVDLNLSQSMVEKYMRQALKHLMSKTEVFND